MWGCTNLCIVQIQGINPVLISVSDALSEQVFEHCVAPKGFFVAPLMRRWGLYILG